MKENKTNVRQVHENRKTQKHEFKEVENTPFNICTTTIEESDDEGNVVNETEEYRICIGNQAVTDKFDRIADAIDYIEQKPWHLITALAIIINERKDKHEN